MTSPLHTLDSQSGEVDPPRTAVRPTYIVALGVLLSLLFTGLNSVQALALHLPLNLKNTLIAVVSRWMLFALLAPLVGLLVARAPLAGRRDTPRILLHFGVTAGLAFLHCVIVACIYGLLHVYPRGSTWAEAVGRLTLNFGGVNFVIFWAIDGAYHALRYHDEVRARERLAADLRAQLSRAQLENLRGQLNPHFLFNTLNTVSTLALTGQQDQVVRTLGMLGDLLRVSLDPDLPQEIPLSRELDLLASYLAIQRIRFGDRLSVELEIEGGAFERLLPSMLLQPLVENAIQHGIASRPGPGRVRVRALTQDDRLCVRIEDSGPGFAPDADAREGRGIGLANTRSRLAQLYGERAGISFGNHADGGGLVQILLPGRTPQAGARRS